MKRWLITVFSVLFPVFVIGNFLTAGDELSKADSKEAGGIKRYIVKPGDTLSQIAERLLGSPKKMRYILQANNVKRPDHIRAGEDLVIPDLSSAEDFQTGVASWYGEYFHGRSTSSGDPFDMYAYTAAHRTLPLGTIATVTNLENGEQVIVTINDRGPYIDGRIIDLSYEAARSIQMVEDGITEVAVGILSAPEFRTADLK